MSLKEKLHIMVVDDMSTSRGLITQALDELGISNYVTESSGEAAWKRLVQQPVHLILSDMNMPGMDGLQLLHAVRSHKSIARTGFILVTGRADPQTIEKGAKLGMNNFIKKPFDTGQMRQAIEKVVGKL